MGVGGVCGCWCRRGVSVGVVGGEGVGVGVGEVCWCERICVCGGGCALIYSMY